MTESIHDLNRMVLRLSDWASAGNFAGYDPYDALNSPLAPLLSFGTRWGRIALTQFGRRSPINYRPLLLIHPAVNPKGLGLFLESYVRLYRINPTPGTEELIRRIISQLISLQSSGISGGGWGYHFPWQNRTQLLPRWTPTIVNSSFIGHALLDAYELLGIEDALKAALSIPGFILNDLHRKEAGDDFCFSYTPLDQNYVHNANMLGASLLARIAVCYDRPDLLQPALSSMKYSVESQLSSGGWYYAETPQQQWIDSFHTGFNLEALRRFLELGLTPEYREVYQRGVHFYSENFFLDDGTPKYYHNRLYLVDIHAPAESIFFFCSEPGYRPLAQKILDWTVLNMYNKKTGLFYFRKAKYFTIKTPYMRWAEAWIFRGLTRFLETAVNQM